MTGTEIVILVILILHAAAAFVLGGLQLTGRGPLLNSQYPAEQAPKPDPKPYYRQSGIILLLVGVMMLVNAAAVFLHSSRLTLANAVIIPVIVIYTIVSTAAMTNQSSHRR
ncbi:MAG: DUF3784 domain-containing protein [Oscillospiraceae bacterium]|nr:DUF3784 domain-containing protein [Oscillospiraceae bacterium]